MFTVAERITVVECHLDDKSYAELQSLFHIKYHKEVLTKVAVQQIVNKFRCTGFVGNEQRSRWPPVSPQRVERVRESIIRSPKASTCRLRHELNIPKSTVWKVLHYTLKKKAYHIQVLHRLEEEDYAARQAMCYVLCRAAAEEDLMNHVLFSYEATFHLSGLVN